MSNDAQFINGLIVKAPRDGAPDFVKGGLSIKREEMIASLQAMEGDWINLQIKESREGKWYAQVDTWKPNEGGGSGGSKGGAPQRERPAPATKNADFGADFADDDIPFVTWGAW